MEKIFIFFAIAITMAIVLAGGSCNKGRFSEQWDQQNQQVAKETSAVSTSMNNMNNKLITTEKTVAEVAYEKTTDLTVSSKAIAVKTVDALVRPIFSKTWSGAKIMAYEYDTRVNKVDGTSILYRIKQGSGVDDINNLANSFKSAEFTVKTSQQDGQSAKLSVVKDNIVYNISYEIGGQDVLVGAISIDKSKGNEDR